MDSKKHESPSSMNQAWPFGLSEEEVLTILKEGKILGGQQIPLGSNHTFHLKIESGDTRYIRAIYKPRDGEMPLPDFPEGSLYKREYAAYLLGTFLGWPKIPLTVIREGPYGVGSVQLYVESEKDLTYFDLISDHADDLLRFAVFDVLVNNADRKAGHCIRGLEGGIWSIDHGLTFHTEFKLRTVMLEFWGVHIPRSVTNTLQTLDQELSFDTELPANLLEFLTEKELRALRERLKTLLKQSTIPKLDPYSNVPWPLK